MRAFYLRATVIGYLVWLLVFQAIGRYAATLPTRDITLPLDRAIPFVPMLVWAYELCYLFPFLPVCVVRNWHRFNVAVLAAILANAVAFIVYLVFPVALPRPVPGSGLSAWVVTLEYAADFQPGANKLPSLHVAFAWLVWLACRHQGLRPLAEALILLVAGAITVATLFVKQHVVLDVAAGVALAFASWAVARALYPGLVGDRTPPEALLRVGARVGLPVLAGVALLLVSRAASRSGWL